MGIPGMAPHVILIFHPAGLANVDYFLPCLLAFDALAIITEFVLKRLESLCVLLQRMQSFLPHIGPDHGLDLASI